MPLHLAKRGLQPYCLTNTEGSRIIDGLFADEDQRVSKSQYSGFSGTNLADLLRDCESVILCGIAADCCILQTAFDAAGLKKHVYIPYQTVSATTLRAYVSGLAIIAKSAGAVVDLAQVMKPLEGLWEARLEEGALEQVTSQWYSAQLKRLEEFRRIRPELFASPMAQPREVVAHLETFLGIGAAP